MLGWLILFTFLTGMFSGSTLLFGLAILMTNRSDENKKTNENLDAFEEELGTPASDNRILSYKD